MRIAINGAGIAGPTLAYWLQEAGHHVLLIEEAPALRAGGYFIDFWGLGYDIAERMGLFPRIRELGYQVREVRFVDERGLKVGGFSADVFARLVPADPNRPPPGIGRGNGIPLAQRHGIRYFAQTKRRRHGYWSPSTPRPPTAPGDCRRAAAPAVR